MEGLGVHGMPCTCDWVGARNLVGLPSADCLGAQAPCRALGGLGVHGMPCTCEWVGARKSRSRLPLYVGSPRDAAGS